MKEYIVEYETMQVENSTMVYGGKIKRMLIRCKDCRHAKKSVFKEKFKRCDYNGALKSVDDFCSWAERKESS